MESALLQKDIDAIREHVTTMNNEMGELRDEQKNQNETLTDIRIDIATIKTDVSLIKKTYWIVVSATVGALATGIINLLEK